MPRFRQSISSSSDDISVESYGRSSTLYFEDGNKERLRAGVRDEDIDVFASAMRFVSVDIPNGAIVDRARLRIYVLRDTRAGAVHFAAFAEDNSDRPTAGDLFGWRAKILTASRATSEAYRKRDTPSIDVTDIIQEVINRPGWKSGNSLTIAAMPGKGEGELNWVSFAAEEHSKSAPQLTVDWRKPIRLDFSRFNSHRSKF